MSFGKNDQPNQPIRSSDGGPVSPSWHQPPAATPIDPLGPSLQTITPPSVDPSVTIAEPKRSRGKTLAIAGVVGGALMLTAVGGGAYYAFQALLGHDDRATAAYAPQNSVGYVAINTDPTSRAWLDAWDLAKRAGIDDELAKLPTEGLEESGEDATLWDTMIKPAIGREVGFAVWPGEPTDEEPRAAAFVMVGDEEKARQALVELTGDAEQETVQYRDATYQVDPEGSAVGFVDEALVVAGTPDAFEDVIDAYADGALDDVETFTAAADRAADDPLVFAWTNGAAIADLVKQADLMGVGSDMGMTTEMDESLDQALDVYEQLGQMTVTVKADDGALRTAVLTEGRPEAYPTTPAGDVFAAESPASTLFYAASADLYETVWQPMIAQLEQFEETTGGMMDVPSTDEFSASLGFDIENDLLAHLVGSYAVSVSAAADPDSMYGYAGDLRFSSQVDDPAPVQETIDSLAEMLESGDVPIERVDGGFAIEQEGISGEVSVRDSALRLTLALGEVDGSGSLTDDSDYQRATAGTPENASMTGYLALNKIIDLLPEEAWADVTPDARAAVEALGPMSWSTAPDEAGTRTEVVLFID